MRKGMMVGSGKKGYHNVVGRDPAVHSQSAKGIKQPQQVNIMGRTEGFFNIIHNSPLSQLNKFKKNLDVEIKLAEEEQKYNNALKKHKIDGSEKINEKEKLEEDKNPIPEFKKELIFANRKYTLESIHNINTMTRPTELEWQKNGYRTKIVHIPKQKATLLYISGD